MTKQKKDGSVSNEKDYVKVTEKIDRNLAFFKNLSERIEKASKDNQERIHQNTQEKPSNFPGKW